MMSAMAACECVLTRACFCPMMRSRLRCASQVALRVTLPSLCLCLVLCDLQVLHGRVQGPSQLSPSLTPHPCGSSIPGIRSPKP